MAIGTRLKDKVAIVTGASAGIGRAVAILYASEGAYVVCSSRSSSPRVQLEDHEGKPTHDVINALYPAPDNGKASVRSIFVKADISVAEEIRNLVKECVRVFGRLDIMVNNAGSLTGLGRIHEVPEDYWDRDVGTNGRGTWLGCSEFCPRPIVFMVLYPSSSNSSDKDNDTLEYAIDQMLSQEPHPTGDRGWIVNMVSVTGLVGAVGSSPYCAAKGAIVSLTKALALEYGSHRIHVNAVAPAVVLTPLTRGFYNEDNEDPEIRAKRQELLQMHPFGPRLGTVEEVARGALFLASDDAAYVTGHVLAVDGGFLVQPNRL